MAEFIDTKNNFDFKFKPNVFNDEGILEIKKDPKRMNLCTFKELSEKPPSFKENAGYQ